MGWMAIKYIRGTSCIFLDQRQAILLECMARGLCTEVLGPLCALVLAVVHEGHLSIVKLKQYCRDQVWRLGIDREIEPLVKDSLACHVTGKTGHSLPLLLWPWSSRPWQHLQLDICREIHRVPHNQCNLVEVYDLHSKWLELTEVHQNLRWSTGVDTPWLER